MFLKLRTLLLPFFVMVFSVLTTAVQAQTYAEPNLPAVTSDKGDYAPGEVAHITGSGWTLDQQVHVEFKEDPDYPDYHIYDVDVDAEGNWKIDYLIEQRHLGVRFTVIATGKTTNYQATAFFTDANRFAVASGNWNDPIWASTANGVAGSVATPTSADAVVINSGKTVTMNVTGSCLSLSTASGTATIDGSQTLSVGTSGVTIINGTTLVLNSSTTKINASTLNTEPVNGYTGTISGAGTLTLTGNINFGDPGSNKATTLTIANKVVTTGILANFGTGQSRSITLQVNGGNIAFSSLSNTLNNTTLVYTYSSGTLEYDGNITATSTEWPATNAPSNVIINGNVTVPTGGRTISNILTLTSGILSNGTNNVTLGDAASITRQSGSISAAPIFGTKVNVNYTVSSVTTGPELPTSTTVLNNLSMRMPSGSSSINLNADVTVNGILSFVLFGKINTGGNTLTLASTASVSNASAGGYVNGNLRKIIAAGTTAKIFEIGDASTYAPVAINFSGAGTSGTGNITASTSAIQPPIASGISQTKYVNRKWTITNNGVTFGTYSPTFNFVAGDLVGSPNTNNFIIKRLNSGTWSSTTTGATSATSTQATGLNNTEFGEFAIGETATTSTTTTFTNATTTYGNTSVNLVATVTPTPTGGTPDGGSVEFFLKDYPSTGTNTSIGTANKGGDNKYTLTYDPHSLPVKTYTIISTFNGAGVYATSTDNTGTLQVDQRSLNFTGTRSYDGTPDFTAAQLTAANIVNSDAVTISGNATVSSKNVNTYTSFASNNLTSSNNNYTISGGTVSVKIDQKKASVSPAAANKTYGDDDPTLTGTLSGFLSGDNVTASYSRTAGENVGDGPYTISATLSPSSVLGNYDITYNTANFTIKKANADFNNIDGYTGVYDGNAHGATGTVKGVKGETLVGLDLGDKFTNVPGGTAEWTFKDVTGNYNDASGHAPIDINKAPSVTKITITGSPFTYNGSAQTPATVSVTGAGGLSLTPDANYTNNTNAGTATASYSYAGDDNHNGSADTKDFTIGQRALLITANDKTKTYGQTVTFAGTEFTPHTGDLVNGDAVASVTLTSTGAVNTATVAGSKYDIVASEATGTGLDNYDISYAKGKLTVTRAHLTVTADNKSKTYDGKTFTGSGGLFTATVSGFVLNETSNVVSGTAGFSGTATTAVDASVTAYTITPTLGGLTAANYDFTTFNNGGLTINTLPITIRANDQSKTYGTALSLGTAAFTIDAATPMPGTESIASVTLTSTGAAAAATFTTPGPTYPIVPSAAVCGSGTKLSNYSITYANGILTINTKAITVTAKDQTKTYGQTFTFAGTEFSTAVGALVNGDKINTVTLTSTGSAATSTVAGSTYPIVAKDAVGTGLSNYTISYADGKLTITKATLTIVNTSRSKVYGATLTNADFAGSISGVTAGDNITVTRSSTGQGASATVNTYPIVGTIADPGYRIGNYTVSNPDGVLTVTTAAITVVANNAPSRQYSDPNPTFTGTLSGVLNGDGITASYTTTANSTSGPGTYDITPVLNDPNGKLSNYSINSTKGTFTITPEDAMVDYTGDQIMATATATTTTATVILKANIIDISANSTYPKYDANPGDIRNAKVMFVNRDASNAPISGWIPVSTLINAGDTKIGTVSYNWTVNLGTATDLETQVGIIVDNGSYIRNEIADNVVVTVYKPNGDFITGGGYIVPTQSVGSMKADVGSKTNFGFNVKFNKSGTNLQGNMNIIFRRKENDGKVHSYQIKANSMVSLGVNATNVKRQTAQYVSKTNLTDVTNPLAPVAMGGNKYLYVNMIDNGEPGTKDSISFVLVDGTSDPSVLSNIIYSSNWISNKTQQMNLGGGNVVVHSGFNVGSTTPTVNTQQAVTMNNVIPEVTDRKFGLTAFPNPTQNQFKVHVESSNTTDKITLLVFDAYGRTVRVIPEVTAGQTIMLGNEYRPGTYYVEMLQGKNRTQVKLLKVVY